MAQRLKPQGARAVDANRGPVRQQHKHDGTVLHPRKMGICPYLTVAHDVGGVVSDGLGDTKVNELQRALHKHKVGGLQVAMDDAGLMNRLPGSTTEWGNGLQLGHQARVSAPSSQLP